MVGRAAISAAAIWTFHSTEKLPAKFWTATLIGAKRGIAEHDQTDQIVVPDGGKLPQQHDGKGGHGDGQQNPAVDAKKAAAVDLGGVKQFIRDAGKVAAEEQRRDRDAEDAVHQNQPGHRPIKMEDWQRLHERE